MKVEHNRGVASLRAFLVEHPTYKVYDYSSIRKFEECPARYNYVYNHELQEGASIAASFSSLLIHAPIATWYASVGRGWSTSQWQHAWDLHQMAVIDVVPSPRDRNYSLGAAKELFNLYVRQFQPDINHFRVVSVEEVYWSVFPGVDNAVWLSKPDIVLQEMGSKQRMTLDIKASLYDFNAELVDFDRQFLGQVYETGASSMCKAFIQVASVYSAARVTRDVKIVDAELLVEWRRDILQRIKCIQTAAADGVWVKQAPTACVLYNRMCPFIDLCKLGSTREMAINMGRKSNPWAYVGLGTLEEQP